MRAVLARRLMMWCAVAAMVHVPGVLAANVTAPDFPSRSIKIVVPFGPGGATDLLGRLLATHLGEALGGAVMVENRPGGSTIVATQFVARSPADGYTLLLGGGTPLVLNPATRPRLAYDPVKDFTYLGQVARMDLVLVANQDMPGNTLKDVI